LRTKDVWGVRKDLHGPVSFLISGERVREKTCEFSSGSRGRHKKNLASGSRKNREDWGWGKVPGDRDGRGKKNPLVAAHLKSKEEDFLRNVRSGAAPSENQKAVLRAPRKNDPLVTSPPGKN